MKDIIKQLTAPVIVTLLGVAMIIVGAANGLSVAGSTIQVSDSLKIPTMVIGFALMAFGAYLVWRETGGAAPAARRAAGAPGDDAATGAGGLEVFDAFDAAFPALKTRIRNGGLKVARAELIQHSSERAYLLVRELAFAQADISLYLQHPETLNTLCSDLRQRVISRLKLYPQDLVDLNYRAKFQIYLYRTPASFNGLRIWEKDGGSVIALSWYTYKNYEPLSSLAECKFGGSANPCLVIDSTHKDYRIFKDFFEDFLNSCEKQGRPPVFQMTDGKGEWQAGWPKP